VEELPLYGTGGWRPFGQPALDQALVAFLDCFCQLESALRARFPAATQILPYRMLKDKVVDKDSQYLVRMQLNSEERWTKAMKCVLLNLKRAIGIVINMRGVSGMGAVRQSGMADGGDGEHQQQSKASTSAVE